LHEKIGKGWKTWDICSVTSFVFLPSRVELSVSFIIPSISYYCRDLAWNEVKEFGEHALGGGFTDVTVTILGNEFRVLSASADLELVVKILPLKVGPGVFLAGEVSPVWGGEVEISQTQETIRARARDNELVVDSPSSPQYPGWDPCRGFHLDFPGDRSTYLRVNSTKGPSEIDPVLARAESAWLADTIQADRRRDGSLNSDTPSDHTRASNSGADMVG